MRWGATLELVIVVQALLLIMGQLGSTPGYNLSLCFFGLYSLYSRNARALLLYMALTAFTIIIDITWAGIYGPEIHEQIAGPWGATEIGSTANFGLAMFIINMFAKFAALFFARGLFTQLGGVWSLQQPVTGADAGPDAGAYDGAPGSISVDMVFGGSGSASAGDYRAMPPGDAAAPSAEPAPAAAGGAYAGYQAGAPVAGATAPPPQDL